MSIVMSPDRFEGVAPIDDRKSVMLLFSSPRGDPVSIVVSEHDAQRIAAHLTSFLECRLADQREEAA